MRNVPSHSATRPDVDVLGAERFERVLSTFDAASRMECRVAAPTESGTRSLR
ncbi:hypothetical protein NJ7G_0093 [Natrinema sp. J7-2]|nr:hypothetical protein NJ7G_0093 [Natrinema sp. J7-2]